jgi:UPF0042 nucleotide-binding protein
VVIITGMSGAGKTSALKVFEDLGFEAVDNPPLRLLGGLMSSDGSAGSAGSRRPLAIGVDIRTRDFDVTLLLARIKALRSQRHLSIEVLFIDADDETLTNRFTETRRRHPIGGDLPVPDGIAIERALLRTLREQADLVIETTRMDRTVFRELLEKTYATASWSGMTVFVASFGFRNGLPRNADLVFDVRFLRNPYYDPQLRPLTGRDSRVSDYVMADAGFEEFYGNLTRLLEPLLPRYEDEGKRYLTIAIGCTGGRHRSVATVERLGKWLAQTGRHVLIRHRDAPPPEPSEQSEGTAQ